MSSRDNSSSGSNYDNCVQVSPFAAFRQASKVFRFQSLLFISFIILFIHLELATAKVKQEQNVSSLSSGQFKLDCQPGEQRHFNYESSTKIWGSSRQQVELRASLRVRCMEAPSSGTLKYLVEILTLKPAFEGSEIVGGEQSRALNGGDANTLLKRTGLSRQSGSVIIRNQANKVPTIKTLLAPKSLALIEQTDQARAEPVFEEIGESISETADKVKRSVSGWFSRTWGSVKDFFSNIFSSSERSSISRDQAFSEAGIDIAAQCKADKGNSKPGKGLPIDDSVFEDLEPKYYIGAASVGHHSTSGYEFDANEQNGDNVDRNDDELLSFFDDPKPAKRAKRAANKVNAGDQFERLLKLPFVFLQSRSGKIIEIRFSNEETDLSIKNFKRHLCDLFATNLEHQSNQTSTASSSQLNTNEVSPIGKHSTNYLLDSSNNSSFIKQTLIKQGQTERDGGNQSRLLVKALALVGMQTALNALDDGENDVESRDPASADHGDSLSVLRSINSTSQLQLSSRTIAPDIERIEVRVKQVQQINGGRMTGSAGQLGISLLQAAGATSGAGAKRGRVERSATAQDEDSLGQVEDIADLLRVSSSFSVQLVPASKLGNFLSAGQRGADGGQTARRLRRDLATSSDSKEKAPNNGDVNVVDDGAGGRAERHNGAKLAPAGQGGGNGGSKRHREPLVIRPANSEELQALMLDWRKLESQLQFSATNLISESSKNDNQAQRLEILRDQVQLRLNEEFMRNRIRRRIGDGAIARESTAPDGAKVPPTGRTASSGGGGDLGLSLTQLVLDTGFTSRRKGSIYATLEEVVELELALGESTREGSMGRLLRDTVRMDRLRAHCKSSIANADELLSANFRQRQQVVGRSRKRLGQCKQLLQLLLPLGVNQAADLVIELMDECNRRLLEGATNEELGHGPSSRYYRSLRQQLTELVGEMGKPSEELLDKLMSRLQIADHESESASSVGKRRNTETQPEFVYVAKSSGSERAKQGTKYNKSLLRETDDLNNNDGAGSLVMTITSLAAKPSIGRTKRLEVADKLLGLLKSSTCSLFDGPDLDILESMANFQEPLDEVVGKVVHLARRCKHQDQYLVACVHALAGQLQHKTAQRYLVDQLRSANVSCTVKSEIVLTLIGAILVDELKSPASNAAGLNLDNNHDSPNPQWPASGLNQVDEVLLELVDENSKGHVHDRKCLHQQVAYYMSKKQGKPPLNGSRRPSSASRRTDRASGSGSSKHDRRLRQRRAVKNDNSFWDEAQCKRWALPEVAPPSAGNGNISLMMAPDLIDEIDDNSIMVAMANNRHHLSRASRQKNFHMQRLIERESSSPDLPSASGGAGSRAVPSALGGASTLRRRHKCSASKTYGPKNAEATLKAEVVNDLIGARDENKFLARFRLSANFLGNKIDVGRMYLWHQKRVTRAHANILGKSLWDTSHSCQDKAPRHFLYMPLFDFSLWLLKVSVGLRLHSEMGFFTNCDPKERVDNNAGNVERAAPTLTAAASRRLEEQENPAKEAQPQDELELYPTISLRASGEATAKFVVARAGMSLASQYGYQGNIRVSRQPDSCMSIYSAHQPMNLTFSSWFQLWDSDCHYWGSRNRAEPQATRWRLSARKPTAWLEDECLSSVDFKPSSSLSSPSNANHSSSNSSNSPIELPVGSKSVA